jgi:hypothetical protein
VYDLSNLEITQAKGEKRAVAVFLYFKLGKRLRQSTNICYSLQELHKSISTVMMHSEIISFKAVVSAKFTQNLVQIVSLKLDFDQREENLLTHNFFYLLSKDLLFSVWFFCGIEFRFHIHTVRGHILNKLLDRLFFP